MADLRIFSYPPTPRVWKATIAARFCGVEIEVRRASGRGLRNWLWDYDACPLSEEEQGAFSSFARTGRVGMTGAETIEIVEQPFPGVFYSAGFVVAGAQGANLLIEDKIVNVTSR
jgi:hypothetical protein